MSAVRGSAPIVLALLSLASPCSAQSCPDGTALSSTEMLGEEMIIHCAKPQKGPEAALTLMRTSELGRRIGGFLEARGIPVAEDLRLIRKSVASGELGVVDDVVKREYGKRRQWVFHVGDWLRPAGRLLAAFTIRSADLMLDLTENFETLEQHRRHPAYWWDKTPVSRTKVEHELDVAWKEKWVKDHRYDEFPGF